MELPVLKPGKYVVAVSGGVDSMVLLDILSKQSGLDLVVAHFNHGIRKDSSQDEKLVLAASKKYSLPIEVGQADLGPAASEAAAREARYEFLNEIKQKHSADAIITAHHQDDLIETAFINILRGTGPRGLTAMIDNPKIIRPFLHIKKEEIIDYAKSYNIAWHDDSTNQEEKYLRNHLRINVLPKLDQGQRQEILHNLEALAKQSPVKQQLLEKLSEYVIDGQQLSREKFSGLPSAVALEVLIFWFRQNDFYDYDKRSALGVQEFIKAGRQGAIYELSKKFNIILTKRSALIETKG